MERKKQFINEFDENTIVNDIFVVKQKRPVEQYKNGYRFELRVSDSTGEIMYKFWGPNDETKVQTMYDSIKKGDVVHLQGRMNEWNDILEISANEHALINILEPGMYHQEDFIKKTEKNIDVMFNELMEIINSVQNEEIKKVLLFFFNDEQFVTKYKKWPAAMYIHHGWIGGLLEHALAVTKIALDSQKIHFKLDKDLIIAGSILHDVGKMREFSLTTSIDMTTEGKLLGHVHLGIEMLKKAFDHLQTPKELQLKLNHIILTHMGEYGSTKTPAFPEALLIHKADDLNGNIDHMQNLKDEANTEEDTIYTKHYGDVYLK